MIRLIRLAFWVAASFAFVMAILPHPPELHVWDKWQHIAAFFVITVLGRASYPRLAWPKLLLAMVAFGGFIELVQMLPEIHRDGQLSDWLADIVAVVIALGIAGLVERLRATQAD